MRWLSILGLETSQPKHTPEIVVQPRRVRCEHRLHRANRNYFSSSYSRYSIVDCTQAAKIVGDHENRELKGFLKRRDGFVTSLGGRARRFGASRNSQAAATAVRHVSIAAARST